MRSNWRWGVSRGRGFGNVAMNALRQRGNQVFPVNAGADQADGEKCDRRLEDLPVKVDGVVTAVPPAQSINVMDECARLGIPRVWMQQGSESPEAEKRAQHLGLQVEAGACILMHARPTGIHAFHGWVWRRLGKS